MNIATVIVIAVLAALVVWAIISMCRARRKCSGCPLRSTCSHRL